MTRRSVPTPLRRGAAAVAVTGGALTLIGVANAMPVTAEAAVAVAALSLPAPAEKPAPGPSALEPVRTDDIGPEADVLDTAELVKAVQLAEKLVEERLAAAPPASPAGPVADCGLDTSDLGAVKAHVRAAAEFLGCRFGEPTMFGVAGRGGSSDHPGGRAIDFMVDRSTGNALAECALRNQDDLGITYVIWRQRINFGEGWRPMEDRGGVTANHFDHVHVSFASKAGGTPNPC